MHLRRKESFCVSVFSGANLIICGGKLKRLAVRLKAKIGFGVLPLNGQM